MLGEFRRLWCFLDGDLSPFLATIDAGTTASDLREEAKRRSGLPDLNASSLVLWKLIEPEPVVPDYTLSQRIRLRGDVAKFATQLDITEKMLTLFPQNPLEDHVHILVTITHTTLRAWKRSLEEPTDERDPKRIKGLTGAAPLSKLMINEMVELHKRIQMMSDKPEDYSDPSRVVNLPFPSTNTMPARFAVSNQGSISYTGRMCFMKVWETFLQIMGDPCHRQAIYVYGGKGFGKSHILLALACLLIRHGHRVVYIPDCRAMLSDSLHYLRTALLFAFAESEISLEINRCMTPESLADFCHSYWSGGQLCFIVDQLNALDPEPSGQDNASNDKKSLLSRLLRRMSTRHIEIQSASANHESARHMVAKDTGDQKIPLMGGMTTLEMSCWWRRHDSHFRAFSTEDKQKVEDLTGRVPLLLNPFLMHSGKPLESLEPLIWDNEILASVGRETIDFAMKQRSQLTPQMFHDEFVPLMRDCLTSSLISGSGMSIDHRYFYLDSSNRGHYSCGLAREAITQFLRRHSEERIFLGAQWLDALHCFKNNPSVIGFIVEQVVISKIASCGINSGNFEIPAAKIVTFEGGVARLSRDKALTYYVPLKSNLKAIDALFVRLDQKKNTAHVVAIQITVAKRHKDSEAAFLEDWDQWVSGLKDFAITTSFVWIHDGERGRHDVEEKVIKLRMKDVQCWPQHDVHWVSVGQVDVDLANALESIQLSRWS